MGLFSPVYVRPVHINTSATLTYPEALHFKFILMTVLWGGNHVCTQHLHGDATSWNRTGDPPLTDRCSTTELRWIWLWKSNYASENQYRGTTVPVRSRSLSGFSKWTTLVRYFPWKRIASTQKRQKINHEIFWILFGRAARYFLFAYFSQKNGQTNLSQMWKIDAIKGFCWTRKFSIHHFGLTSV